MDLEATGKTQDKYRYVLPETTLMALIGGADLLLTVYLVAQHRAVEMNPLFNYLYHQFGHVAFIIAKFLLIAGPLAVAELARRRHPVFVRNALRFGIMLYVGIYVVAYIRYNF